MSMKARIRTPILVTSLAVSSLAPYWAGRQWSSLSTRIQPQQKTPSATIMVEDDALLDQEDVCTSSSSNNKDTMCQHVVASDDDDNAINATTTTTTLPSSPTVSPCCTTRQLLLSISTQNDDDMLIAQDDAVDPLDALQRHTSALIVDELGLDLLSNTLHCHKRPGHASTAAADDDKEDDWTLLQCWGFWKNDLGHVASYQWMQRSSNGQQQPQQQQPLLLDLFLPQTSSSLVMQNVVDTVAHHFGGAEPSHVVWHQAERGFRYSMNVAKDDDDKTKDDDNNNSKDAPLSFDLINPWVVDMPNLLLKQNKVYKRHVAHLETIFQHIDIYDTLDTHVHGTIDNATPPDREVYFDDIMQSRKRGLEAYHEALVHPSMLSHPNPRRVAIFGGGEGATLREVLKHATVQECVMIEIDQAIVEASRDVLRDWNDCSDLRIVGEEDMEETKDGTNEHDDGYRSCYDDPRATVYYEDAIAWFVSRYLDKENVKEEDKFDVIILDSLDPGSNLEFSDLMYGNLDLAKSLHSALRDGGILGGQVGIEYQRDLHQDHEWLQMVRNLEAAGFFTLKDYMEGNCGFDDPWKFFVAPTDKEGLARFSSLEAEIDLELVRRAVPTRSGALPFHYIDGATMAGYLVPSRMTENMYCEVVGLENEDECERGIDHYMGNAPISSFEVRPATNPKAGRGVFAKVDIPDDTYLALEDGVHSMLIMPSTLKLVEFMGGSDFEFDGDEVVGTLDFYAAGYGMWAYFYGNGASVVDPGILTFANHGCKGEFHTSNRLPVNELNASENEIPEMFRMSFYNPSLQRHHWVDQGGIDWADKPIPANAELYENYLFVSRGATEQIWAIIVESCREMCAGRESNWTVSEYEDRQKRKIHALSSDQEKIGDETEEEEEDDDDEEENGEEEDDD